MFGISFSELLLVGLVALLVLGPDRLPGAARTAGLWIGRLKRSFNAIKTEVERELGADEIRRQLHNEHILQMEQEAKKLMAPLTDLQDQAREAFNPQQPAQPEGQSVPSEPPAAPSIAPNSRLNSLPGAGIVPSAAPEAAPAAAPQAPEASQPTAASQPPASPETPRTP
ncbi:Sec-independent protein translocase protein TatB [Pseudomonas nitroreducens]|uniref:Sec-independent protein translocase protein TatB n=2 Tax=Pseudomonas nitroreducens TaxID=46680 RepID=UPI001474599D|nr:Sec-independent protein translocase protein TatB [Pseudomonas nitroreducens]MCJ1878705.1 Sec-independent protein translocase protein TatB [Pseudomonas nitroreducens]MCJ1896481.1 Sec-independent protein translocase protein TatB [Pseudomonas nitroreducens]MDH1071866.1 Sec-independent protein translocase protein TatB [Pseudomonas nitroreducens]NMZ76917.1 Sec-independent protein translocase subunit TatB [Pseudomonas nitroreducens]WEW99671.1 Sec-independent protein translocase protein TatB [Pseu